MSAAGGHSPPNPSPEQEGDDEYVVERTSQSNRNSNVGVAFHHARRWKLSCERRYNRSTVADVVERRPERRDVEGL